MSNTIKTNYKLTVDSLNQCSTCIHWVKQPEFISAAKSNDVKDFETGICVGGGFDKNEVKATETCSLWELQNQT
jgi:hypothetical protein